jgi:hypothetical protein
LPTSIPNRLGTDADLLCDILLAKLALTALLTKVLTEDCRHGLRALCWRFPHYFREWQEGNAFMPLRLSRLDAEGLPLHAGPGVTLPGKLSGPLLDTPAGEATGSSRVAAARDRAVLRLDKPDQALRGAEIDRHATLDPAALKFMHTAAARPVGPQHAPRLESSPHDRRPGQRRRRCRSSTWRRPCSTAGPCTRRREGGSNGCHGWP